MDLLEILKKHLQLKIIRVALGNDVSMGKLSLKLKMRIKFSR